MSLYKVLPLSLMLISLLLSACASKPKFQLHEPEWEMSGKLAVQEKTRNTKLLFRWQQEKERYLIHLMNILGQIELTLLADKHLAAVMASNGKVYQANNADELMQGLTGWHFPVEVMRLWLQGKPDAQAQQLQYDQLGQLTALQSLGWQVEFSQYKEALPYRLRLTHAESELSVIVIIKQHAQF